MGKIGMHFFVEKTFWVFYSRDVRTMVARHAK